jgi:hypothetical protein
MDQLQFVRAGWVRGDDGDVLVATEAFSDELSFCVCVE